MLRGKVPVVVGCGGDSRLCGALLLSLRRREPPHTCFRQGSVDDWPEMYRQEKEKEEKDGA